MQKWVLKERWCTRPVFPDRAASLWRGQVVVCADHVCAPICIGQGEGDHPVLLCAEVRPVGGTATRQPSWCIPANPATPDKPADPDTRGPWHGPLIGQNPPEGSTVHTRNSDVYASYPTAQPPVDLLRIFNGRK